MTEMTQVARGYSEAERERGRANEKIFNGNGNTVLSQIPSNAARQARYLSSNSVHVDVPNQFIEKRLTALTAVFTLCSSRAVGQFQNRDHRNTYLHLTKNRFPIL